MLRYLWCLAVPVSSAKTHAPACAKVAGLMGGVAEEG